MLDFRFSIAGARRAPRFRDAAPSRVYRLRTCDRKTQPCPTNAGAVRLGLGASPNRATVQARSRQDSARTLNKDPFAIVGVCERATALRLSAGSRFGVSQSTRSWTAILRAKSSSLSFRAERGISHKLN